MSLIGSAISSADRTKRQGRLHICAARPPAAAERAVEIDEICPSCKMRRNQRLPRSIYVCLRSEYSRVTVDPVLITQRREFKPPPLRRDCLFERGDVLRIGRARGERVRYFTKGGLNRLFVLRNRDFFSDARSIELRPMRAASKNRQRNVGTEGPRQCARFEQSGERGARHSVLAGYGNAGEECGARRANLRIGGAQHFFRRHDVRPAREQIRGTPAGKSANIPCGSNAAAGGKLFGSGCPSSRTSAFSAWARARNWFCSFVRARAAALSASVRSSALATPASTRSLTKRSDSSAAASASCVTFNCSSNARSVRYCLASCATSAISAARQACAVDR